MNKLRLYLQSNPYFVLFCLWAIATTLNLNKAFHIDDAFHLEAARWIQQNPLKPMSGDINWSHTSVPLSLSNQPPLYFYLIAAVGSLFGYTEIVLHLFQSVFVFISIIFFYKLVKLFAKDFALVATALLALCPAFLVNQNLMTDIPILSISIVFIYLILTAEGKKQTTRLYLAATLLSSGILIKYSLLPLLLVLAYKLWQTKRPTLYPVFIIPVAVIASWALLNYLEFGDAHVAGRQINLLTLQHIFNSTAAFILTLGSIAPFTILFLRPFLKQQKKHFVKAFFLLLTVTAASVYVIVFELSDSTLLHSAFWIIFFINGLVFIILSISTLSRYLADTRYQIIMVWGIGIGLFIILFAPFMATRHVLLLLPPLLISCSALYSYASDTIATVAIYLTASLGIILGVSDWLYADFYRKAAPRSLSYVPAGSKVWSVGHWGWQWYSKQAGMQFYDYRNTTLKEGDYLISPSDISKQKLITDSELLQVNTIVYRNHLWNKVTTAQFARFYNSFSTRLPWYVTSAPTDSVIIYKVVSDADAILKQ